MNDTVKAVIFDLDGTLLDTIDGAAGVFKGGAVERGIGEKREAVWKVKESE